VAAVRPRPDRILDYREYPILYVDDEPENLRIFELTFKREFSIVTAQSGDAGLELLNTEPVALVLSDHRMPGMTGVEFLTRALEVDPKAVRMLVTAYGDAQTLGNAINSGAIYKFVPKPWQPDEMRVTLRRAIEAYALDREREQLVRELTLLNRVSKSITQELALEPLLDLLLETVIEELGYDGAGILFFDAAEAVLSRGRFAPQDSPVAENLRDLMITQQTAPAFIRCLRDGEAQCLTVDHALGLEAPLRRWVSEVAADQILVMPLVGKQRTIGALAVDNRRGGGPFTGDDQTLLEGLSHQAVIAIENARLVEDLRRSREQIRRADRLGTLGTLAAGLAHEINNPLVSIHTFLSMAPSKRREDDEDFWGGYHALAAGEVDRIRRLVETMQTLGRDTERLAPREAFDPGELAAEVASLVQREAGRADVELRIDRDPHAPKLVAVRDHMHQVLLNLLLNALHATPPGGSVEMRIYPDPEGEKLCMEVCDTGEGISEENLSQIFDPFFTTKDPDKGTGLGLMICHRLVTDHGGTIEVRSREGEGTTFCVRLPAGEAADGRAQTGFLDPSAPGC
jgi:signal transduction histidine kinase/FixJ family two-component response regulator